MRQSPSTASQRRVPPGRVRRSVDHDARPSAAQRTIDFFRSYISPRAVELATRTLADGWVSEGRLVEQFELALTATIGITHPVAVNSGTSALHLALALAGVGPGDEVILPAQTFVATGLAILMQGAVPVFADIEPTTGNICPRSIAERTNPRTKAVMVVHFGGYPCDLDTIAQVAEQHGVPVIEDAAHALVATYHNDAIGNHSPYTAFSFQAIKHLTTGDGGLLATRALADAHRARKQRWFGIDRQADKPSPLGERVYELNEVGFKYHMNDLAAAVGLGNLEEFPARLARRQELGARYRAALADVAGLELLHIDLDRTHAYWLFTVLVERREDFVRKLASRGVPASVVHMRIDRHPVFGGQRGDLPGQAKFEQRQISLPVHDGLSNEDFDYIVDTIRSGW